MKNIPTLTLDTNLLHEYWKERDKKEIVEALLCLAEQGKVDLAVTARVREDIPRPPLAEKLNELPVLNIAETGSVTRLGYWVLGRDMLGDEAFDDYWSIARELAKKHRKEPPDWRDWDHMLTAFFNEIFLTWDEGILCLSEDLKAQFGLVVKRPEEYSRNCLGQ